VKCAALINTQKANLFASKILSKFNNQKAISFLTSSLENKSNSKYHRRNKTKNKKKLKKELVTFEVL